MRRLLSFIVLSAALKLAGATETSSDHPSPITDGPSSASPRPWETGALNIETGILWEVGALTPLSYRLIPTQLSWRSKEFIGHGFANGSRLMIRHRLTLIGTWVQQGPESHYVGFSGSPSIEWWDPTGKWSLFTGSGGGLGVIDSRGVRGGQGQDFTFNWFIRGGIEHVGAKDRRFSVGIMYQHMSNGGQTNPNPGIDALGFTAGYSWAF
jgi:lipid A 3-O-deacylase